MRGEAVTDMRRYCPWPNDRWIDTPLGQFVLASDAEAAIAALEEKLRQFRQHEGCDETGFAEGYDKGQQDMLAKCIAAVEAIGDGGDADTRYILASTAATLRDLQEKT